MGVTKKKDVAEELKSQKNGSKLAGLGKVNKWNPFSGLIVKNYLSSIATGKADHEATAKFLQDIMETGRKERDQFIEDCAKDSSTFSQPIKRQKIEKFATQAGRFKVLSASNKKLVMKADQFLQSKSH